MTTYRGRFAPTPSGPLHFGSLFAAVVSFLDARAAEGHWLVRIEDIDPPREQPGAATSILSTLEKHGLFWDESVTYQSQNSERYQSYLTKLTELERLFWCTCSRKDLAGHKLYPGHCRHRLQPVANSAIRLRIDRDDDRFNDLFQGMQHSRPRDELGDVILRRRDNLFAYQLAVVCDDIEQNVTHVIRGIDLLESTYWQRELYRVLNAQPPTYGHFAVIHSTGSEQKLSKQNLAPAVDDTQPQQNLQQVFRLLNIHVERDAPEAMLQQAIKQWRRPILIDKQILHCPVFQLD
ncbi:tRNA glutamyl-Q(34) synthetase GluQRS [Reinekea sp. G2M2-21]|uniref:tRNA glutamyl-Q(34) synthetase GluQRS n=1 Tax=Reinekea sp. G2M2-21 TaxID=2788942 RepID=UPI00351C703D